MSKKRRRKTILEQLAERLRSDSRTQVELANAAGVTQPTIHKILNGGTVRLDVAEAVARAVGCPLTLSDSR